MKPLAQSRRAERGRPWSVPRGDGDACGIEPQAHRHGGPAWERPGARPAGIVRRVMLLTVMALPALAQAAPAGDIARLKVLSDAWDRAILAKDRAAIEANMAEDFRQIDARGNVENKASFVDGLVSPDLQLDPYTVEDFEVRLYGDTALLSGRTRMTGRYQGQPFSTHYRYIDIYVRRRGVWKIVSVQISPMRD